MKLALDRLTPAVEHVLCLGAHCDDIEIGCSGALLRLLSAGERPPAVTWVVFSGEGRREEEGRRSASAVLGRARSQEVLIEKFRDGFFPFEGDLIKEYFEDLKGMVRPDLVFTHYRGDLHQDHRTIAELTWNTFRNHLILEYEVPKYDGDFGSPNVFVELDESVCRQKIGNLVESFATQAGRPWFVPEVFWAVLRLRGMEAAATSGYAEGFYGRKLVLG